MPGQGPVLYISFTYWRTGRAFPPLSERRDHPGPPIRKLTTGFEYGAGTDADMKR